MSNRLLAATTLAAFTLLASHTLNAQSSAAPTPELKKVDVKAKREQPYAASEASSATRLATPLKETPLTVQVIDQSLIRDKNITTARELADAVAGVQQVVGYGNTASQWFVIRGFSSDAVNYRDGYRSADKYTPRDFANVERVEFVKGPASVLYGQAQPAGAVNTITKTPLAFDNVSADVRAGSFASFRSTLDANKAIGAFAARLNVAAENNQNFTDFEKSNNYFVAPSLRYAPTERVSLLYSGEYQRTVVDGFSNGLPMAPGVFDLPSTATTGRPWAKLKNNNVSNRVEANVAFSDAWSFRQGAYVSSTARSYAGASPAFNQFDGTPVSSYPVMYNGGPKDDQRNTVVQSEITGTIKHGTVTHRVLTGFEAFRSRFNFAFYDQFGCDAGNNCFGGYTSKFATGLNAPTGGFTGASEDSSAARTNAAYLNDQISWKSWRLMAGVRHDRAQTKSGDVSAATSATTGRLGLLLLIAPQTSVYGSVGQSFVPNVGARTGGGVLDPEKGLQAEFGVKHSWSKGLESTLSLFSITKSNIRYRAASNPTTYLTFGEQESRGIEATLAGQITPMFQLIANYSYLDYAKVTKDRNTANIGKSLYGVARNSGNIWGVHELSFGLPGKLTAGAGVVSVGARTGDENASGFMLPAYTRVDVGVFYRIERLDLALNVKNANDARIFDTAEGYFVQRQAPRNVSLSAGVRF